jgi:hypothetical protein
MLSSVLPTAAGETDQFVISLRFSLARSASSLFQAGVITFSSCCSKPSIPLNRKTSSLRNYWVKSESFRQLSGAARSSKACVVFPMPPGFARPFKPVSAVNYLVDLMFLLTGYRAHHFQDAAQTRSGLVSQSRVEHRLDRETIHAMHQNGLEALLRRLEGFGLGGCGWVRRTWWASFPLPSLTCSPVPLISLTKVRPAFVPIVSWLARHPVANYIVQDCFVVLEEGQRRLIFDEIELGFEEILFDRVGMYSSYKSVMRLLVKRVAC